MAQQSKHTLGEILCRWYLKIWLKSSYQNQCKMCWNGGYFQPKINVAVMIKGVNSKRVLSEWLCRGGKRPGGVEQGVERLSFLCCCTWSCSGAILWLYTICLLGFNHMRRNACGFTGKKYRLYYTQGCLCSTAPDREDVWRCDHKKEIPAESWKGAAQICQKPLISMR